MAHQSGLMLTPCSTLLGVMILFSVTRATASPSCPTHVREVTPVTNCTSATFPSLPACPSNSFFTSSFDVGTCTQCSTVASPGFVCRDGKNQLCPIGFYCPFNPATSSYDTLIECPSGTICYGGFVEPLDCRELVTCDAGADAVTAGSGLLILLLFSGLFVFIFGGYLQYRKTRDLKLALARRAAFSVGQRKLGEGLTQTTPAAIEFKDVGMKLKSEGHKEILSGITGSFPPGALVALMGPSGGGKTTFMNALLGRAPYADVSGSIKVNGAEGGLAKVNTVVGFVPQDDIVHADLTVYENLLFNALLRLPADVDFKAKQEHVQHLLEVLGLSHIHSDLVGSPEKRGVSGGQKKRVNIGLELAAMPSVVFMDEPTSGLDGAATLELAQCLSELRKSGLTIICVVHQPRWSVFKEFTHLLLLGAGGQQVYCGPRDGIQPYLESLNFRLPAQENPADWMIDVVCGLSPRYKGKEPDAAVDEEFKAPHDLFAEWKQRAASGKGMPKASWNEDEPAKALQPLKQRNVPPVHQQALLLLRRVLTQHDNSSFALLMSVLFLAGLLFGILSSTGSFSYKSLYSELGSSASILGMLIGIQTHSLIHPERLQYTREFKSGVSVLGYWLAKVSYDLVRTCLFTMAYIVPKYSMSMPLMGFGDYAAAWIGYGWFWSGVGILVGTAVDGGTSGMLLLVFLPTMEMFLSGTNPEALTAVNEMSPLFEFISRFTSGRWLYQKLYVDELASFPPHVINFEAVATSLNQSEISRDFAAASREAETWLWMVGLMWRCFGLITLLLVKYAQGGGFITKVIYAISHQLDDKFNISTASSREMLGHKAEELSNVHNNEQMHGEVIVVEPNSTASRKFVDEFKIEE